jgi:hypothetical protein
MIEINEYTLFIIQFSALGVIAGLFLIGMLFYLLNLTGDYKSIQSITFLLGSFGLLGAGIAETLFILDHTCYTYLNIATWTLGAAGCFYFVILVYNSYFICSKIDFAIIILIIIPIVILGTIPHIVYFTRHFGIKDNLNLELNHIILVVIDMLSCVISNFICYQRFYKYKNNDVMDLLLQQYKMGDSG